MVSFAYIKSLVNVNIKDNELKRLWRIKWIDDYEPQCYGLCFHVPAIIKDKELNHWQSVFAGNGLNIYYHNESIYIEIPEVENVFTKA